MQGVTWCAWRRSVPPHGVKFNCLDIKAVADDGKIQLLSIRLAQTAKFSCGDIAAHGDGWRKN
jgi:hypothetical protein